LRQANEAVHKTSSNKAAGKYFGYND
jgi:hypothetical protein